MNQHRKIEPSSISGNAETEVPPEASDTALWDYPSDGQVRLEHLFGPGLVLAKSGGERQAPIQVVPATSKAVRPDDFKSWSEHGHRGSEAAQFFAELTKQPNRQALWIGTESVVHYGQLPASKRVPKASVVTDFGQVPTGPLWEESLKELRNVAEEAAEDGFPAPNEAATTNAEKTLRKLYANYPGKYTVSPTEEGDVSISVPAVGLGNAMTVECDADGGLICFVNINGQMRRMKDYDADMAWESSDFIVRALRDFAA